MHIRMPDPHIGRCQNLRPDPNDVYGRLHRCTKMEAHEGACKFQFPNWNYTHRTHGWSTTPPTPWKDPDEQPQPAV